MIDKEALKSLARNIEQHAFRRGYVSAFTFAAYPPRTNGDLSIHITRECEGLIYGNAEVGSVEALDACIEALDGRVDYVAYDTGLFGKVTGPDYFKTKTSGKSILLPYSDMDVWAASVRYMILGLVPDLILKKTVVVSTGLEGESLAKRILMDLAWHCRDLWVFNTDDGEKCGGSRLEIFKSADIIIGASVFRPVIEPGDIELTGRKPLIVDAGIGTISLEAAEYSREKGIKMIRVDNRAAMAGTLFSIIQTHDLVSRVMGEGEIEGVPVVAGGVVGAPGTIIVDSISNPVQVIGIADGTGKVKYDPGDAGERSRLEKVERVVERNVPG